MRTISHVNTFQASFLRAMDGDTIAVNVHLPFGVHLDIRVRILDADSWELNSQHRDKALECAARINSMLRGVPLTIAIGGGGKDRYGRWRARIFTPTGDLLPQLIGAGIAWRRVTSHPTETPEPPTEPLIVTAHLPPPTPNKKKETRECSTSTPSPAESPQHSDSLLPSSV